MEERTAGRMFWNANPDRVVPVTPYALMGDEPSLSYLRDVTFEDVTLTGPTNGDFALLDCKGVTLRDCNLDLPRMLCGTDGFELSGCELGRYSTGSLHQSMHGRMSGTSLRGARTMRECEDIEVDGSFVLLAEFGRECRDIRMRHSWVHGDRALCDSKKLSIDYCAIIGRCAFQGIEGSSISHVHLDSEDALWHTKGVTVTDSTLQGHRLGWHSENLTLVNCQIVGRQSLCHCKGLRLIGCVMAGAEDAFEGSDIDASLTGTVDSVCQPKSGIVVVDVIGSVIRSDGCEGRILVRCDDGTTEDVTDR